MHEGGSFRCDKFEQYVLKYEYSTTVQRTVQESTADEWYSGTTCVT